MTFLEQQFQEFKDKVRSFIAAGNFDKAIEYVNSHINNFHNEGLCMGNSNMVILLSSEFTDLKKKETLGLLDNSEVSKLKNRLNFRLLALIGVDDVSNVTTNVIANNVVVNNNNVVVNNTWIIDGLNIKNPKNLKEFLAREWMPETDSEFKEIAKVANDVVDFLKQKIEDEMDFEDETKPLRKAIINFNKRQTPEGGLAIKQEIFAIERTINDFLKLEVKESGPEVALNNLMDINDIDDFYHELFTLLPTIMKENVADILMKNFLKEKEAFWNEYSGLSRIVFKTVFTPLKEKQFLLLKVD